MSQDNSRNIIIKWCALLTDALLYAFLVWVLALMCPDYIPGSIVHHVEIAIFVELLCFVLFSLVFPTLIHKRKISYSELMSRNFIVVLCTQVVFLMLWHSMSVNSSNEGIYSVLLCVVGYFSILVKRLVERMVLSWYRRRGGNTKTILFIGSDPANLNIYNEIMSDPATGYRVVGYYSNDVIEDAPETLRKLGSKDEFEAMMDNGKLEGFHVDDIYCSLSHSESDFLRKLMCFCDKEVIRFFYVPRMFQNIQLSLRPELLGSNVVFSNHNAPLADPLNKLVKRLFDIMFSSLILLMLLPLFPVIALIIKLQSRGPVFFKQKRTGMNGQDFMCYKFRSMNVNADSDRVQATKDDPRKFPFGNFMRKANIDELPQFFNVLKGDMSIVGPRPHMTLHTEMYSSLIDKYMVRHFAKPGITGLAQVTGFRGETNELWQMEGRIKKDIWYIENWTFILDLKICLLTAWSVFFHDENAY